MSATGGSTRITRRFSGWVLAATLMVGIALVYAVLVLIVGIELYSATALPMPASNR